MASRYPDTPQPQKKPRQNIIGGSRSTVFYDSTESLRGRESPLSQRPSYTYGTNEVASQTNKIQWHLVQIEYLKRNIGNIVTEALAEHPPHVIIQGVTDQVEDTLLDQRQLLLNSLSRLQDFIVTSNNCCATTIIVLLVVILALVAVILVKQLKWV